MTGLTIATVGNPNCGKTTLFNALTGSRQKVGNWPGVTVDRKEGTYVQDGQTVTVVDLPGTYSLGGLSSSGLDEAIARDYILSGEPGLIVNVVDAANLERNLYLTAQLIEMRVPVIVALNMTDVATDHGIEIDIAALSAGLGCPVVPLVASRGKGIEALRKAITQAGRQAAPTKRLSYGKAADAAVAELAAKIGQKTLARNAAPEWLAARLIEGVDGLDWFTDPSCRSAASTAKAALEASANEDADIIFADARYRFAGEVAKAAARDKRRVAKTVSDRIDAVVLSRAFGIPIFLVVMYVMFLFAINFAGVFIDFFDLLFGTVLVDEPTKLMTGWGAPDWLITLLPGGIGAGIQTVSTFVPVIAFLFLFLSLLEDSGYMARAAFVMDRFMRAIGLPGKSFIPMILGFGCNVPAVMATRTLDNRRDRVMTAMMAPFMSCGARLPVYALFAAAFFPTTGQNIVFLLYLIGIAAAVLTGLVLKTTVLRGETSPFIMELPPYHVPTFGGVLRTTWDRLKAFVLKASKMIIAVVVLLGFLNSVGTDGSFGNDNTDRSVLAAIGESITPVFAPMGMTEENWPATVGIFTGILAKEAVVGTLNALYENIDGAPADAGEEEDAGLWGGVAAAFATIPENFVAFTESFSDPFGLSVGDVADQEAAASEQEVSVGTYAAMAARFDGTAGAFAYLLAVLLYMPCIVAIAAIWRETGTGWAIFASAWTSGLAYGASVLFYQAATFGRHAVSSTLWIVGILAVFAAVVAVMRWIATDRLPSGAVPRPAA
ncbi:Fe(2+) transporter permease subunit FeoB [Pleomorphomonas sp. NRK KF1]|uniref:Fe(2+) transporter permease subunit FeoB n=1 Tax=Pleomorphomonas sp. NRK KF1 TaxID=2943000 RepID=UPI002043083A|nr:Fe(2+) transporter permease subunit FeoB [Pleomorphomonas sp. NRK KF1]MCM5553988.1 Fe(2+) transporter permease subunit FeoB [Pleomorphomonas sp. NRK KF1]